MRVLVLWADDKSSNLGVRVLAAGTEALVHSVWPEAEVVFHTYGAGASPVRVGDGRAVARELVTRRGGLREWVTGFDLVFDTRAGDSFADIYGMSRLVNQSIVGQLAHRWGVPVVLGPQTYGPFMSTPARAVARRVLRSAHLVLARDSLSAEVCADLGRPVNGLTTDVVFALPQPQVTTRRDVVLNVSGLLWQPSPHVDSAAYRRTATDLYHALVAEGRKVSLLAHVLDSPDPDNDVPAIRELVRLLDEDIEVIVPTSLNEVRSTVAGAKVVIGSRMHACLNALSVGTPAIALAYSRKFAPLLGDLGWRHTIRLSADSDMVVRDALAAVADPALVADCGRLQQRANELLVTAVDRLAALPVGLGPARRTATTP